MSCGRKVERKEGRKNGRKEGRKDGRKRKEGRTGFKEEASIMEGCLSLLLFHVSFFW
jgi:hypothetical protein